MPPFLAHAWALALLTRPNARVVQITASIFALLLQTRR